MLFEARNVDKQFGSVQALAGFNFHLQSGEVVGLVGDNGAGKSTFLKIIAGNYPPTAGDIILNRQKVALQNPHHARDLGIETVYQNLALCDDLSAMDNIFLGRERLRFGLLDRKTMRQKASLLLSNLESDVNPDQPVGTLSGGQRQAVALARSLLSTPQLLLLDEPTAAISVKQVPQVLNLIRKLKQANTAIVIVSHRLPDIFAVADRIVVLRRGQKVADKPTTQTSLEEITGLITGAVDKA